MKKIFAIATKYSTTLFNSALKCKKNSPRASSNPHLETCRASRVGRNVLKWEHTCWETQGWWLSSRTTAPWQPAYTPFDSDGWVLKNGACIINLTVAFHVMQQMTRVQHSATCIMAYTTQLTNELFNITKISLVTTKKRSNYYVWVTIAHWSQFAIQFHDTNKIIIENNEINI